MKISPMSIYTRLLFPFLAITLLISCTPSMQMIYLESSFEFDDKKGLIYSDSLVRITYDFYSRNGKVNFRIYNASKNPIYIDWKNSAYITSQSEHQNYWTDVATFNGTIRESEVELTSWLSSSAGTVNGKLRKPERITFLPPGTEISVSKFQLANGNKIRMSADSVIQEECINWKPWKDCTKMTKIKRSEFNASNTPLSVRNYLTVSQTEDFVNPIHYDFDFWVSSILEMNAKQLVGSEMFLSNLDSTRSDNFHPYKTSRGFFILPD